MARKKSTKPLQVFEMAWRNNTGEGRLFIVEQEPDDALRAAHAHLGHPASVHLINSHPAAQGTLFHLSKW